MSSRRREGGIETPKMEACTHNRKFVTSQPRQIQRSKWRFYANRGFHFSSHRPSAILYFHSSSFFSLFPLPFFFRSLLTAHFCHACRANRRPPSQRPPFLIYRETWEELEEGGERAIYPPYLAYGVDGAWLLILLEIFL